METTSYAHLNKPHTFYAPTCGTPTPVFPDRPEQAPRYRSFFSPPPNLCSTPESYQSTPWPYKAVTTAAGGEPTPLDSTTLSQQLWQPTYTVAGRTAVGFAMSVPFFTPSFL